MIITIADEPFIKLTSWAMATGGMEFSGLGLIERRPDELHVYDVDLLGVGSFGYTEIQHHRQTALMPDPNRKLWFHRHPIGNGVPGPHNWSGRDHQTATREPLGGIPALVQWAVSIVLTPGGWTGRLDVHVPKLRTFYLPVLPQKATIEQYERAHALIDDDLMAYVRELSDEHHLAMSRNFAYEDEAFEQDLAEIADDGVEILVDGENIFTRRREVIE